MSSLPATNSYIDALMKFPNKVCAKYYAFEYILDLAQITEGNVITSRQMKLLDGYNNKVLVCFEKDHGFIKKVLNCHRIGMYIVNKQLITDRMIITGAEQPVLATNMTDYIDQLYSLKYCQQPVDKISVHQLCVHEMNIAKLASVEPDMDACLYMMKNHLHSLYGRLNQILSLSKRMIVVDLKSMIIDAVIISKSLSNNENLSTENVSTEITITVTTNNKNNNKRKRSDIEEKLQFFQEQLEKTNKELDMLRSENAAMSLRLSELERSD